MALDQVDVDKLEEQGEMSFLDHLEELRWHIIRSLAAVVIFGIIIFLFHNSFFSHVIMAPTKEGFFSFKAFCNLSQALGMGETLCIKPTEFEVIAVGFGETFITAIKISIVSGLILAFPYILYELWKFIKPGLYDQEVKLAKGFVGICSFLFLLGIMFGYYIITPFGVNFLMSFNLPEVVNKPTLASYISYLVMFTVPAGIIFELPVVVYFFAKVGLVTAENMKKYRRHAIIGILLCSAVLTPPDVVTQFLIGIPLYFLYEISIIIAKRVQKQEAKRELQST